MKLASAIKDSGFIMTAECRPPRGAGLARLKACAGAIGNSVAAIYAPENEDGVRLSSLAASSALISGGAEPIMALLTRDLNRIALQSTVLGAVSMGISNFLCTTGRHQALTTSGTARGVYDIDPIQLISVLDNLRKNGELADGQVIDEPISFTIGVDTNPFSDPVELQVMVLEKAIKNGADFVITQPVFNLDRFNVWMSHVRERGLDKKACIIASVMPLASSRQAVVLSEKYSALDIGDDVANRLDTAADQKAAGVHLAKETIDYVRGVKGVRGVHIMAGDDVDVAAELIGV